MLYKFDRSIIINAASSCKNHVHARKVGKFFSEFANKHSLMIICSSWSGPSSIWGETAKTLMKEIISFGYICGCLNLHILNLARTPKIMPNQNSLKTIALQ